MKVWTVELKRSQVLTLTVEAPDVATADLLAEHALRTLDPEDGTARIVSGPMSVLRVSYAGEGPSA
jgi:hypothetical protein